jgi:prolyl-tRNA editing enzyme YbaK/EbsC (Cys-tRNA(Pro) deacylase)
MGIRDGTPVEAMTETGADEGLIDPDEIERRVDEHLSEQDVPYEVVACDPGLADTDAFCNNYGYALEDSANTIVVVGKSDPPRFVACVLLATTRLDVNHAVKKKLGTRKASFADADQTRALTGMAIGGVTALALPADLPIWVDSRVVTRPRIVLGGGSRRRKIVGPPTLLTGQPGAEVVDGLATDLEPPG